MGLYTLTYRGYQIDPVIDPDECGDWKDCSPADAHCFEIYPPNIDDPRLNAEVYSLCEAVVMIDREIDQ